MNTTLRSLVLAAVTAAAASVAPAQGLQWILNPATGNEYAVTPPMTWDAAAAYAQSVGADLCWIGDQAENTWVADHFLSILPIYLGGTDLAIEGLWTNPYGWPLAYTNWAPAQPDNALAGQHRLVMWDQNPLFGIPRGTWDDQEGLAPRLAVLERPLPQWLPYGNGCAGSSGVPTLQPAAGSAAPRPGAQLTIAMQNAPQQPGLAVAVVALERADVDLTFLGMPSCSALVLPIGGWLLPVAYTGSAVDWPLPLPALEVLRGLPVFVQMLVLDPNVNAFGATTSAALEIRIGY